MRRAAAPLALVLAACAHGTAATTPPAEQPVIVVSTPAPPPPPPPVTGTFTLARGADTIGTEQFARTADSLHAQFTARGRVAFAYDARLAPDASTARVRVTAGDGGPVSTATFAGDSVTLEQQVGDSTRTRRGAAPAGAVLYLNPSPSLMEQIVRRARALGGQTVAVPIFVAGGGGLSTTATVTFTGPDAATLDLTGTQIVLRLDPTTGALTQAAVSAQNLLITRSP